jgi:hypothetical protein
MITDARANRGGPGGAKDQYNIRKDRDIVETDKRTDK